jgi:hypothetical protein
MASIAKKSSREEWIGGVRLPRMRLLPLLLRTLAFVALAAPASLLLPSPARAQPTGCGVGEWVCHQTADGLHPDGVEQALVWLMNRARQDPSAEADFLAGLDDPVVRQAVDDVYQVDLDLMQDEFDAIAPKPPAAFDRRLYTAALGHANLMISEDQDNPPCGTSGLPPCQLERVAPAGFFFVAGGLRGNSFGFADGPILAHAAWNIDWAFSSDGMFPGRVHRLGVMSEPGDGTTQVLTNVGIAAVEATGGNLGPLVVVADYANANNAVGDHYDRFLVGTVWEDLDHDGLYDPGEGKPGVGVTTDTAAWTATTSLGGGYAIPILDPGPVEVTFSGGGVATFTTTAQVGTESVLVDYVVPEPGAFAAALAALVALATSRRSRVD